MNTHVDASRFGSSYALPQSSVGGTTFTSAYSVHTVGPKYASHDINAPMAEGKDIAGLVAGTIITLGPLAAYAFGFGL